MVAAKNSRVKVEIPDWLQVYESRQFYIECEELSSEGEI
jgi:hypothetical protein